MLVHKLLRITLAATLITAGHASLLAAQDHPTPKQDMKKAGTETKDAAKDTGHGIKQGTTTAYHKTANGTKTVGKDIGHGTKVGAEKTADGAKDIGHGTKKLGDKIAAKPTD